MVIAGKAMMMSTEVIKVDQEKIGRRIIDMPGARRLMMVTMKLKAPAIEATPRTWRPSAQKSISLPEKRGEVSGAYPYQPWSGTNSANGQPLNHGKGQKLPSDCKAVGKPAPNTLVQAVPAMWRKIPGSEKSTGI